MKESTGEFNTPVRYSSTILAFSATFQANWRSRVEVVWNIMFSCSVVARYAEARGEGKCVLSDMVSTVGTYLPAYYLSHHEDQHPT